MGQTEPQLLSDPMSDRKKSFQFWNGLEHYKDKFIGK